jgi:HEAT repeat protein
VKWLRSLLRRGGRVDPLEDPELALQAPERHLRALVALAEEPGTPAYAQALAAIEGWPPRLWLRLDAYRLGAWSPYGEAAPRTRSWEAALSVPRATTLLVALGSTHSSGYVREAAVRVLASRHEPIAGTALALRAVDHVPEVRAAARSVLVLRRDAASAAGVVPILCATRERASASGAIEAYLGGLPPDVVRSLVRSSDPATRLLALERAPLRPDELLRFAGGDSDTRCRTAAARRILRDDPRAGARALLEVRPARVRALALELADQALLRERLDQLLLDRSTVLRRAAQRRAQALGVDLAVFYRERLPARAAILGLGKTGAADDVEILRSLVERGQTAGIRRAAVRGLGGLAPDRTLLAVLPPLLDADSPGVVREAARQLRRLRFVPDGSELERLLRSSQVWTRRAALALAVAGRRWPAPLASLALYADADERLRETARSALAAWLSRRAPTAGSPTGAEGARLEALLEQVPVEPEVARHLRFHAQPRA